MSLRTRRTGHTTADASRAQAQPRQLLLLAVCSLALVTAAYSTPAIDHAIEPPRIVGEQPPCSITTHDDVVPGERLTITVGQSGEPIDDARVWYDDRFVGTTDRDGRVTGEVPYTRELQIRVEMESGGSCTVERERRFGDDEYNPSLADDAPGSSGSSHPQTDQLHSREAADEASSGRLALDDGGRTGRASAARLANRGQSNQPILAALEPGQRQTGNGTGTIPIDANIELTVLERPYPGDTVTVITSIGDKRLTDATLTYDGQVQATTNDSGMARVQIPDDGREVLWLVVQRGDLAVRQSIEIRVLTVHVRPSEPLPLPGQQATIHARVAGEPADDVRLSAGGEPVGETGLNGSLPAQMPADPTTGVEAQWRGQTATTSFLGAYAPTIATLLMVLVAFVGSPLVGYWIGGKRGVVAVLALWALAGATYATFVVLESVVPTLAGTVVMTAVWLLGTTIVGYWIDGLRGVLAIDVLGLGLAATVITLNRVGSLAGLAVLATTILAEVVVLALAYPNARDELGDGLEGGIRDVAGSLVSTIAWAATNLDAVLNGVVEDLAQFVENLRSMDISGAMESLRALAGRILAGVRRLPGLVASLPGRFRTWMRSPPDVAAGEDSTAHADATRTVDGPPLRKLWRRFARRVAPESWERRTPGELSRRAIDQGYPREPVRTVTHTFRDVEYGDSPLPTGRYREVRRAVDQLVDEEGDER